MLQKLSNGAKGGISKFILVGFLFMAVMGLVLTDVGGFFRDGVSSTSVADVGHESVPYHEFDRFARNMLARQGMTPQDAYPMGQVHELLRRYTQDILFVQNAHDLGVRIPDQEIAAQLHKFVEPYMTEGQTTSPQEALNQLLVQQGLNETDFINALRRDMTTNIIQTALTSGASTAPNVLATELLRYQNESRDVSYIFLPHKKIKLEATPTEDELAEFYELSKAEYKIPERRGFTIAVLDPETLIKDVTVSEEDALSYYETNKNSYKIPAGRKIEQAIFGSEDDARSAFEKVINGSSLQESAGENYRGEQLIDRDNAPPALAEALFSEDESTNLRGPVQSPLGWHIINILGDTETTFKTFRDVQASITATLKREVENERLYETLESMEDRIDDGDTVDALVEDYNMLSMSFDPIDQFGLNAQNADGLKSFEADKTTLLEVLFGLYDNELSEVLELSDGRLALIKVNGIIPENFKSFDSVKNQINQRLQQSRRLTQNQLQVQEYMTQLQAGETALSDISDVKNVKNITRNQTEFSNTDLTLDLKARLFNVDPGQHVLSQNADGFIIAKSSQSKIGPVQDKKEDADQMFEQIEAVQVLSTYFDHLAQKTPVKINQPLLEQLYGQPQN